MFNNLRNIESDDRKPVAAVAGLLNCSVLFLISMGLVACASNKSQEESIASQPVERPKIELQKDLALRAATPDILPPEMVEMPGGLNVASDEPFVIGPCGGMSIGIDFVGSFYDFERSRKGQPIPCTLEAYQKTVRRFIGRDWRTGPLGRYYKVPGSLYATALIIPSTPSTTLTASFGENYSVGKFWMLLYKTTLVHKDGITFRFLGAGDDIMAVRVDDQIVLGAAQSHIGKKILEGLWQPSMPESGEHCIGNCHVVVGDWITLEPNVSLKMEVLLADSGGQACLMLAVEEQGVEYPRNANNAPIFPAFKTYEPPSDLLELIYQDLSPGEVSLTNGPVFNDHEY